MTTTNIFTLAQSRMLDEPLVTLALGLTIVVRPDDGQYSPFCPELDIMAVANTEARALANLATMIEGYAEIYVRDWEKRYCFSRFASHRPFIQAVRACHNTKEVRGLFHVVRENAEVA